MFSFTFGYVNKTLFLTRCVSETVCDRRKQISKKLFRSHSQDHKVNQTDVIGKDIICESCIPNMKSLERQTNKKTEKYGSRIRPLSRYRVIALSTCAQRDNATTR